MVTVKIKSGLLNSADAAGCIEVVEKVIERVTGGGKLASFQDAKEQSLEGEVLAGQHNSHTAGTVLVMAGPQETSHRMVGICWLEGSCRYADVTIYAPSEDLLEDILAFMRPHPDILNHVEVEGLPTKVTTFKSFDELGTTLAAKLHCPQLLRL